MSPPRHSARCFDIINELVQMQELSVVRNGGNVRFKQFKISRIAENVFEKSGIDPVRINRRLERQLAQGQGGLLVPSIHYQRKFLDATGYRLWSIARRNRSLLVDISSMSGIWWRYDESDSRNAWLILQDRVPETAVQTLVGEPVEKLIDLDLVAGARIRDIDRALETSVRLDVDWRVYPRY